MNGEILTSEAGIVSELRDGGPAAGPGFTARLIPYGEIAVLRDGRRERFERGALTIPAGVVPLNIDHGDGSLERIGWLESTEDRGDGLYAAFRISDTTAGRDTHTLLRDKVLSAVSAGFRPGESVTDSDGVIVRRSAVLDHVAVVPHGAYKGAAAVAVRAHKEGSQKSMEAKTTEETVPAVEKREEESAPAVEKREAPAAPAADVVTRETFLATEDRVRALETLVETLQTGGPIAEKRRAPSLGRMVELVINSQRGRLDADDEIELRALAFDTTTSAAGLVPDFYSNEVLTIVDTARPYVAGLDSDPIGDHGMDVIYPEVTQKPSVAKQTSEGTEVSSTQFTIAPKTVSIDTFAGADEVSVQVIDRSSPAFLSAFYRELGGIYAQETEQEAETVTLGAVGIGTSILADFSTSAAGTVTALVNAAVGIAKAVKRMPDTLYVSPDRWGQLAELVDSQNRPLFPWVGNGPINAIGQTSLANAAGQVAGLELKMVPNFATNTALMAWSGFAAKLEQAPLQLRAIQVGTLKWELGVYGYFATAVKHAGGVHSFTIA